MKKALFAATIFLAACQTTKTVAPVKVLTPLEKVQAVYPSTTQADLDAGKSLYNTQCITCHGFEEPAKYSMQKWDHILPEMVEKANKYKNANITDEGFILLRKFVISSLK
jgi:cytochrome c5